MEKKEKKTLSLSYSSSRVRPPFFFLLPIFLFPFFFLLSSFSLSFPVLQPGALPRSHLSLLPSLCSVRRPASRWSCFLCPSFTTAAPTVHPNCVGFVLRHRDHLPLSSFLPFPSFQSFLFPLRSSQPITAAATNGLSVRLCTRPLTTSKSSPHHHHFHLPCPPSPPYKSLPSPSRTTTSTPLCCGCCSALPPGPLTS